MGWLYLISLRNPETWAQVSQGCQQETQRVYPGPGMIVLTSHPGSRRSKERKGFTSYMLGLEPGLVPMCLEPNAYRPQRGRLFIVVTCSPTPFPTSSL